MCGTADGQLLLYNHATGVVSRQRVSDAAPCKVTAVQHTPDGQLLVYGCEDGSLVLWDPASCLQLHRFRLHQRSVRCCSFSGDGELLVAGDASGLVSCWNAKQGNLLQVFRWAAAGAGGRLAGWGAGGMGDGGWAMRPMGQGDAGSWPLLRSLSLGPKPVAAQAPPTALAAAAARAGATPARCRACG